MPMDILRRATLSLRTQLTLALACVLAGGCSSVSLIPPTSGFPAASQPVGSGIYYVSVAREKLTSCETQEQCILRQAAQTAQRSGATHFLVLSSWKESGAYVKLLTLAPTEIPPTGAVAVEEVMLFLDKPVEVAG
jgi:hypothetical protein